MTDADKCAVILRGGKIVHLVSSLADECSMCGEIVLYQDNHIIISKLGAAWKKVRSPYYSGANVVCTDADLPLGW
jgi:hypothetical protein